MTMPDFPTNNGSKFPGLRRAEDAPVVSRQQLQAPPSVTKQVGFNKTTHKDPTEQAKLEAKKRARIIGEAFARDEALTDPAVLYPLALRVAYRITRELARHLGVCNFDELLDDVDADAWYSPGRRRKRPGRQSYICMAASDAFSKAESLHDAGLMLLPPTPDNGTRGHIELWHEAVGALVHHLNIAAGAPSDPDYGGLGMFYLVEHGWPTREAIVAYEAILMDEIIDEIVTHGQRKAQRSLRDRHGYRDADIRGFFKSAKAVIRDNAIGDVEEERALMALKLEQLQQRAKTSLDLRVELGTLKQLGIVLGVTRAEPEDDMTAFVRTVKRVANDAQKALPEGSE